VFKCLIQSEVEVWSREAGVTDDTNSTPTSPTILTVLVTNTKSPSSVPVAWEEGIFMLIVCACWVMQWPKLPCLELQNTPALNLVGGGGLTQPHPSGAPSLHAHVICITSTLPR
jgi:hypothetical protein